MNRFKLASDFDEITRFIESVSLDSASDFDDSLSTIKEMVQVLKGSAIMACAPSHFGTRMNKCKESEGNWGWIKSMQSYKFIRQSLENYSPKMINAKSAASLIISIARKTSIKTDPDSFCSIVSIQYCKMVGIDPMSSSAFYIEEIVRSAFGLFPEAPPNADEVKASIRGFNSFFASLHSEPSIPKQRGGDAKAA